MPAPTKAAPNLCKRLVKDDGLNKVPCGRRISQGVCGNESKHISKHKTGFCAKGWCEGKKALTFRGDPAPTCKMWRQCGCSCHDDFDMLFQMSGKPREVVYVSDWKPDRSEFWMPSPEDRMALLASSNVPSVSAPVIIESPAPDVVPATLRRTYTATPTGRAARGQLESWVKDQCDIWLVEEEEFPCTPKFISEEIARTQAIPAPSVGAIGAVFDRWTAIGFAIIERKPVRFISYTPEGVRLGLDGCKDKAKREKKAGERANSNVLRRRD